LNMETKTPGLCECGCGQQVKGVHKRFVSGHSPRTAPPGERLARKREYAKAYYAANREKVLARAVKDYWSNKERKQLYDKARRPSMRSVFYIRSQQPRYRYKNYKSGATKRKLAFPLTFMEFMTFWQKPCSYCGLDIETIGIDRIDSARGYEISNLVPCCRWCNVTKMARTPAAFVDHCRAVVMHQDKMGVDCGQRIVGQDRVFQGVQQVPGDSQPG
jgi:hypothetical protein